MTQVTSHVNDIARYEKEFTKPLDSETEMADPRKLSGSFAPNICFVVPRHAVFKYENVDATWNLNIETTTLNLPRHPDGSTG